MGIWNSSESFSTELSLPPMAYRAIISGRSAFLLSASALSFAPFNPFGIAIDGIRINWVILKFI